MENIIKHIISIFILLTFFNLNTPSNEINGKFIRYSTQEGLSSFNQNCVTQDKEGFIWIGTDNGLDRFDGYQFQNYKTDFKDSLTLKRDNITCLFSDSDGDLWIGTNGGGLSLYNKIANNFFNFHPNLLSCTNITSIAEDKFKNLWIGTTYGLYRYNKKLKQFRSFTTTNSLIADNFIKKIVADGNSLWIAYASNFIGTLNIIDYGFKNFRISKNESSIFCTGLAKSNYEVWISTWNSGIWIYNIQTGKFSKYLKEKNQQINFISNDLQANIWYSTESKGLVLVSNTRNLIFTNDDFDRFSISSNSLTDVFQDKQGNLWITSKQGDLNYLKLNNPFFSIHKNPYAPDKLNKGLISALLMDRTKKLWVGYQEGGIDILDFKKVLLKTTISGEKSTSLGTGAINCIFEAHDGTIWIGKSQDGLKRYLPQNGSFKSFTNVAKYPYAISSNEIRHITEDNSNNLWIATHGAGIYKFNPRTEKFYHINFDLDIPNNFLLDWALAIEYVNEDSIWIGTIVGAVLYSERTKKAIHFNMDSPDGKRLTSNNVNVIYRDSKNNIWLGTKKGLNKYDAVIRRIQNYTTINGLTNEKINNIVEDNRSNIWISTGSGLRCLNPENENIKTFSIQDGLITDEFNACSADKLNETLYFGGRFGISYFNPLDIKENLYAPPVYITELKLFNQKVEISNDGRGQKTILHSQITYTSEIELKYNQNVISFEFSALNFENLTKNQYSYKLEGFDEDYSKPDTKREVTYTNLLPGKYQLKVKASNNDGVWNESGTSLTIIVHPPFWRSNLAYLVYFILFILVLYFIRKMFLRDLKIKQAVELEKIEIRKLQEIDNSKMQFFSNISHEFRTPLTLIVGPVERMLESEKNEKNRNQLLIVHRNVQRLLRLINQLMDFRKIQENSLKFSPSKADLTHFVREICSSFNSEASQRNISYSTNFNVSNLVCWFDQDMVDKIIYNLLSNAFKYTPDNGFVAVSMKKVNAASIEISIKDSGIGISAENIERIFDRFYRVDNTNKSYGTGIGLSFVKELVELHQGEIRVESAINRGAEFIVKLPLWQSDELKQNHEESISDRSSELNPITQHEPDEKPQMLIIEDSADMRSFIKDDFSDTYFVIEASNGAMGVKKAFDSIPDVIICDVMMPEMDGYEVCEKLKQDERTSHIPILLLTARSSEKHTIEGLESGADDYVTKPFSSKILKARIKNLVKSRILLRKKFLKDPLALVKDFAPGKVDEKFFDKAFMIVEKNMSNPDFEIMDFAREIGMSRAQLYRKINAVSGQSVQEFIRIIRLKKAAEMLVTSGDNISEVALNVGFSSLSHFSHAFTAYYGKSPSKFAKEILNRK